MFRKYGWITFIIATLVLLAGCVQTKSGKDAVETEDKIEIEVLAMSSQEDDLNIVRDQLTKNGFDVKINMQPDYGSFSAQEDAGNFDLSLSGWTTVTGNPDYAVRSLFTSGGDYSMLEDEEIDALINKAGQETPEEYPETYKEFEEKLVLENGYIVPMYINYKTQAFNSDILNPDTVRLSQSRSLAWETIDFNDTEEREETPFVLSQGESNLTSLDPIKGNDGSINMLNTNMYVRLVNLTDEDDVTSEASLSYNHAIAEGNEEYYFVLRDDINFAAVEDEEVVDTEKKVSGQDVIYSLDRAKDAESVPDHRTYTLHEHIDTVELVDDLAELEDTTVSGEDISLKESLENDLDADIANVVEDIADVDNEKGAYQVVKLTTTEPFPQVLNYLAHQSAGIVSEEQVTSINTYDVEDYDVNTDIAYGDESAITEGNKYDNHLYASGPYILVKKNDYEAIFKKNPAYMPDSDDSANIEEVVVRFIQDEDSMLSALRDVETHLFYGLPQTKFDVVDDDDKLTRQSIPSTAVVYMNVNTDPSREVANSADLRKSILYSINQEEFIDYYGGNAIKAMSTVSPLVDTGLELNPDKEKVEEFYKNYLDSKE